MRYTKTELHTHLVGMLSAEEFVTFIKRCNIESFRYDGRIISPDVLLINYYNDIQIEKDEVIPYSKMNFYYCNRTEIIKSIVDEYSKNNNISKKKSSLYIYNLLINESLRSLIKQDIKYVEISYSFYDRISKFVIDDDIKDKIKCKFLLSTQRTTPAVSSDPNVNTFRKASKNLLKAIQSGNCVGFDIMGEETKLRDEELDYNDKANSFMYKLEILFGALFTKEDATLRIHSGETNTSFTNTIKVLEMINAIANKYNVVIPPPEIRIGHGLYFDSNPKYVELLKKFKCIIEINATSNLKLSNIKDMYSVPYSFYINNDIPIVISTDGHGLMGTTILKEDKIAKYFIGNDEKYEGVVDDDLEILSKKGR